MKACALALLLALPARAAEPPPGLDVHAAKVAVIRDANTHAEREVTGGCWISGPSCVDKAREKAACCARAERLEQGHLSPPWLVIAAAVVGLAVGAGTVHYLHTRGNP